jgi:hypothetical protein
VLGPRATAHFLGYLNNISCVLSIHFLATRKFCFASRPTRLLDIESSLSPKVSIIASRHRLLTFLHGEENLCAAGHSADTPSRFFAESGQS